MTNRSRAAGLFLAILLALPASSFAQTPTSAAAPPHGEGIHETLPEVPAARPELVKGELKTPRFRILYTERSEGSARALSERIESVRDEFIRVLGRDWPGITEIRIGLGREEMAALALPGGRPPKWAEALAYPGHNIILLNGLSLLKPEGEVTLRHELSHVALGQISSQWPRWFQEGVALYLTGDRFSVSQYSAMFRAVTQERVFRFQDLADGWPQHAGDVEIAYAQSVIFVSHLVNRHGPERFGELVGHVESGAHFEVAFARAFRTSLAVEQEAWEKDLPNRYSWWPILTGGSMVWVAASVLTFAGWLRRRKLRAQRFEEMAKEDAEEDRAQETALRLSQAARSLTPDEVANAAGEWNGWSPANADSEPNSNRRNSTDSELPATNVGPEDFAADEDASHGDEDDGHEDEDDDDRDVGPGPGKRILH